MASGSLHIWRQGLFTWRQGLFTYGVRVSSHLKSPKPPSTNRACVNAAGLQTAARSPSATDAASQQHCLHGADLDDVLQQQNPTGSNCAAPSAPSGTTCCAPARVCACPAMQHSADISSCTSCAVAHREEKRRLLQPEGRATEATGRVQYATGVQLDRTVDRATADRSRTGTIHIRAAATRLSQSPFAMNTARTNPAR